MTGGILAADPVETAEAIIDLMRAITEGGVGPCPAALTHFPDHTMLTILIDHAELERWLERKQ